MSLFSRLLVLAHLFTFSQLAIGQTVPIEAKQSQKFKTVYYADCASGTVHLHIDSPTVYLLKGHEENYFRFATFGLKRNGVQVEASADQLNIDGRAVAYSFSEASNSIKIEPSGDLGYRYTFSKPGRFHISANIGAESITVPVEVVQLAYSLGDPASAIIKDIGFPTSKKKIFVDWPDLETHDGIIYNPDAGHADILEHWRFDRLPNAVFAIRDEKIVEIHSYSTEDTTTELVDWLQADKVAAVDSDANGDEPMALEPEQKPELTQWTSRTGKQVTGRFINFAAGKVQLELANQSKVEIPLRDFSYADQAKLKKLIRDLRDQK